MKIKLSEVKDESLSLVSIKVTPKKESKECQTDTPAESKSVSTNHFNRSSINFTFDYEALSIRTIFDNSEIWFVGKDVAIALGHQNPERAIRKFVDEEDKGVTDLVTPGGKQTVSIINESGVYALIFASQTESAKKFKHWVTHEVLPSIRKQGYYSTLSDDILLSLLTERTKNNPNLIKEVTIGKRNEHWYNQFEIDNKLQELWDKRFNLNPSEYNSELVIICNDYITRYNQEWRKYMRWSASYHKALYNSKIHQWWSN